MLALRTVRKGTGQPQSIGNRRIETNEFVIVPKVTSVMDCSSVGKQKIATAAIKLWSTACEKPQPVLDDWSTQCQARECVVERVTGRIDVSQSRSTRALNQRIRLKLRI